MQLTEFGMELNQDDMATYREALLWGRISAADAVRTYQAMLQEYDCTEATRAAIAPLMAEATKRRDRFKDALNYYNDVASGRVPQDNGIKELPA